MLLIFLDMSCVRRKPFWASLSHTAPAGRKSGCREQRKCRFSGRVYTNETVCFPLQHRPRFLKATEYPSCCGSPVPSINPDTVLQRDAQKPSGIPSPILSRLARQHSSRVCRTFSPPAFLPAVFPAWLYVPVVPLFAPPKKLGSC